MKARIVYSSGKGRICPQCGWPAEDCRCSSALSTPAEPVPARIKARLSVANTAAGKKVTMIEGLPRNHEFLQALAKELKKSCGTGGRCGDGFVELQGDQRERLRGLLAKKGWVI